MDKTPLVSACLCTHNRSLFLKKAIELFCRQTYPNKELVIMNDGDLSTIPDVTGMPIRHIHSSGYEGMTRKWSWAYAIARGEILCTWDDDDYFGPERLEVQAREIIEGRLDACGFPVDLIVSTSPARFWRWKPRTLDDWKESSDSKEPPEGARVPFHDGTAMWRRELLNGIPRSIVEGWQLGLLDQFRIRGARLGSIPNNGHFAYIRHGANTWEFETEDKCIPVPRPSWVPEEMVTFWNDPAPTLEARKQRDERHG